MTHSKTPEAERAAICEYLVDMADELEKVKQPDEFTIGWVNGAVNNLLKASIGIQNSDHVTQETGE